MFRGILVEQTAATDLCLAKISLDALKLQQHTDETSPQNLSGERREHRCVCGNFKINEGRSSDRASDYWSMADFDPARALRLWNVFRPQSDICSTAVKRESLIEKDTQLH